MLTLSKYFSLISFFGLMITLICWITLGEHSSNYPTASWLVIALFPLLFPLRGLLHNRPYTHAWTSFLMLAYLSHAIGELYSADYFHYYAALELLFSVTMFVTSLCFIKLNAKSKN